MDIALAEFSDEALLLATERARAREEYLDAGVG